MTYVHAAGEQFSQGCFWPPRTRFALDTNNKDFTCWDLDWFEDRIGKLIPSCEALGIPPICGRLGHSIEGGGGYGRTSIKGKTGDFTRLKGVARKS